MAEILISAARRGIKSYALRSGRMSDAQKRSYDELSPRYRIPWDENLGDAGAVAALDYPGIFGNSNPTTIEIGFGMGLATAQIAQENPQRNYLGVEVHKPGIGRLLWEIDKRSLANIRIIDHDAVEVLERMIAAGSVAAFHLFFPDPWPKKKHHKRRLVTRPFTDILAEKLLPGGYVYMVTDWDDYAHWALAELSATPGLVNPYADFAQGGFAQGGFAAPQAWRPKTKFEVKGLAKDHHIWELYFVKNY
jgi:tRNA (guanine-N7-)-methyltransferase